MFFFNWFSSSDKKQEEICINKTEYEALIERLINIENMMNNLPKQPVMPKPTRNIEIKSNPITPCIGTPVDENKEHKLKRLYLE